jgi:hypothetical protein
MIRLALVLLVACGSSYEPTPESEADADEAMVVTFEEMAKLAGDKPTCVRWADENGRRWGKRRLQTMVERIQKFEPAKQEAFRAKYGKRIDAASEAVQEISQRCLGELRGR